MMLKKQVPVWAMMGGVIVLLLMGQAAAQDGTAVGEPPHSLVVVEDEGGVDTAVAVTTNHQNINPLGTLTPRAYLPIIFSSSCLLNKQAEAIANLATNDSEQERPQMICNPILARVAYEKALDMGNRNYFGHVNPDGFGPNYLVNQAGYNLPAWWGNDLDTNYIESIAAGYSTPAATWNQWRASGGHRTHVLGLNNFWREQIYYGIGYAYVPGSRYGHYWVFITAP